MCLATVNSVVENFDGVGYKNLEVYETDGKLYVSTRNDSLKMGVWHTANEEEIGSDDNKKYTTGFHIFLSKDNAKDYDSSSLIKVSFKEAHTVGTQNEGTVVIARKIKFEKVLEKYSEKLNRWVKVKK